LAWSERRGARKLDNGQRHPIPIARLATCLFCRWTGPRTSLGYLYFDWQIFDFGKVDRGSSILRSAFGERIESVTDTVPLDGPEAEARAQARFRMRVRQFVTGRGVADSNALLHVGAYVDLQGLGPLLSGEYYLAEVHHIFDPTQGMRTEFITERPGLGRP
jgi:hypothetical protein